MVYHLIMCLICGKDYDIRSHNYCPSCDHARASRRRFR